MAGSDAELAEVAEPGDYVLDPSPAVTRAGLVADLAATVGGWQIDPMIAFLFATRPSPTPYGKWFRVEASMPWNLRALADHLRAADGVRDLGQGQDLGSTERREGDSQHGTTLGRRD